MKISDLVIETFKDCIKGTIFSRQEIIKKVSEKFNVNVSSIIPSDYCYNRWNKGVSETKRLCLFEYLDTNDEKKYRYLGQDYSYNGKVYHKAKDDIEKCVGEWVDGVFTEYKNEQDIEGRTMFNKELLKKYVAEYKENFVDIRYGKEHREIYKWEAVAHFQEHWNVDASDFVNMLEKSLAKTENLLSSGMFFAKKMLSGLTSKEPETVRSMFKDLFDENKDLSQRVSDFTFAADELHKRNPGGNRHYQEPRAISVYLWLKYPEKYYIYQYEFYKKVVKELEGDYTIKKSRKPDSMMEGFKFFDEIREELRNDKELAQLNFDNGVEGFKDEGLTTLTQDVAFFIKRQVDDNEDWEPSVEEYSPNITVERWKELLDNQGVFDENSKKVVYGMLELGGQATCKQLADEFGDTYNFYNAVSVALAKRVQKATNCSMPPKIDEDAERYWPILYVGRNVKGEQGTFEWKLRNELREALENYGLTFEDKNEGKEKPMPKYSKNLILYGPPGTGKTYNTVNYAVAILDNMKLEDVEKDRAKTLARYNELKNLGLIEFCTFHQSFGYEEFIEGIRPVIVVDENTKQESLVYKVADGIFKKFCESNDLFKTLNVPDSAKIWKISLGANDTTEDIEEIKKDCFNNNRIRIGYGDHIKTVEELKNTANLDSSLRNFITANIGDIVIVKSRNSLKEKTALCDAIGIITGNVNKDLSYDRYSTYRNVVWIAKNIYEDIYTLNGETYLDRNTMYQLSNITLSSIRHLLEKYLSKNKVFIIDEINRGNISKIFGELITLIEDSKRIGANEEMRTRLPYSNKTFGVPNNVYLLGTMNTADRSIALIDTALRRRFKFVEMQPDTNLLQSVEVAGVKIKEMLEMINRRIEVLYDREHTIGHSFFMGLSSESTIEDLAEVFECNVIPLLKEYFYDDYERIAAVLGDNLNQDDIYKNFISRQNNNYAKIFNSEITLMPAYKFNTDALKNPEAYKKIYL